MTIIIASCGKDDSNLNSDNLSDFRINKEEVILADKSKNTFIFDLEYKDNIITYNRSLAGTYLNEIDGRRMEILLRNPNELEYFISKGQAWFIPNSSLPPFKLKFNKNTGEIDSRSAGGVEASCFCEGTTMDPEIPYALCALHRPSSSCVSANCTDCDIEICIDAIAIPGTQGGGIVILADTVIIFGNNSNIIFGGRTRIELNQEVGIIYFDRAYISDTVIFEQGYFNATGSEINNLDTNLWVIPFDKSLSATRLIGRDCKGCELCTLDEQKNGCFQCKCSGTGDCDWKDAANNLIPTGVLVISDNLEELH